MKVIGQLHYADPLTPGESAHDTHCIGDWVGPRAGLVNFFKIDIVGGGVQLGPLGTAAANGLLCHSRVVMMMEILLE
jgi:hypothetical protein